MKYFLHMNQDGGCGYTIACGQKLHPLQAITREEAEAEAIGAIEEHDGESQLSSATLLGVVEADVLDVKSIYARKAARESEARRVVVEQREMDELARLEAKYHLRRGE